MGRRGPPKKPTKLKQAQGQRKRDMPKEEVFPPDVTGTPEIYFELSAIGNRVFAELDKKLRTLGLHTEIDTFMLVRYCDLFDQWLSYRDELRKGPPIKEYLTESGFSEKPHPALRPYLSIQKEMMAIERQFGMSPAARASLVVGGKTPGQSKEDKVKGQLYGDG